MRYISLFSGIGGLDVAIDALGGECWVQVEKEPYCRSILDLRYPDVPKVDNIFGWHATVDTVDLVVGGPPCQPVSHAGRRKGTDDDRWLWGEALRVVGEARPERVFFENPMGLRTLGLDTVLDGLTDMGYGGAWEVVAAADVGAPHLRKRIFIMGIKGRAGWEGPTRPPGNRAAIWPTPTATMGERGGRGDLLGAVRGYPSPSGHLSDGLRGNMPTPTRSDGAGGAGTTPKREGGLNLRTYVDHWPTPTSRDYKDTGDSIANGTVPVNGLLGRAVGPSVAKGALNPDWCEWLMNLPIGWTNVNVDDPGPLYGWEEEPDIPRVGLGINNRSRRLTALGNAVVPAQAVFAWNRLEERLA